MAIALRQGDVVRFIAELEKGKVWPPLHGLLVTIVLLVGGLHYQLAVLPSLLGWILTVTFGFLAARRSAPARGGGLLAGAVAVIFIVASPAYRIFATDIMLESLGAGLTLLVLYLYLLATQTQSSVWAWRGLALALTLLFFEKYNYWLLVSLAILAAQFISQPRWYLQSAVAAVRAINWSQVVRNQARRPINQILIGISGFVAVLFVSGPTAFHIAGHRVSLYPPNNLVTVAYAILLLSVVIELRRRHPKWIDDFSAPSQQLLKWHVLPIAVSFLLLQRLSAFLWFISPANSPGGPATGVAESAAFYARTLIAEYHAGLWSALLVMGLLSIAFLCGGCLRPGGLAPPFLVLVASLLVVLHPNQQGRFLHSWLPAAWVGAGVGLACLLYSRFMDGLARYRTWLAVAALLLLVAGHRAQWSAVAQSSAASHSGQNSSLLDLTDTYIPYLAQSRRTAIFTTVPAESLIQWTFLERYPRREGLEMPRFGEHISAEQLRDRFESWLPSTQADTIVLIDIPPRSSFYVTGYDYSAYSLLSHLLAAQTIFRQTHRWDMTRYGCTITIWRRS